MIPTMPHMTTSKSIIARAPPNRMGRNRRQTLGRRTDRRDVTDLPSSRLRRSKRDRPARLCGLTSARHGKRVGRDIDLRSLRRGQDAPAHDGFRLRKLMTVVHSTQFGLIGDDNGGFTSVRPRQLHHVGQVELALGVLVIIFSKRRSAWPPSIAINPALQSVTARSSSLASFSSRMATRRPDASRSSRSQP
jgi:hypothetical protein